MTRAGGMILAELVAVLLAGCSPPAPTGSASGDPASGQPPTTQPARTLSIILRVEPVGMLEGADDRGVIHKALFDATLGGWDHQGGTYPILAAMLPQLNTDTWRVFPDGRMETRFELKPNLTWHDGTPLTAEDVAFSARAERARVEWGLTQTNAELRQMEEILAPDPRTLVIRWKQPYWEAGTPQLIPVPRHLLQGPLEQGDPDVFGKLGYWTTEFVGAGPYRLERWERGAFIEGVAFDGYALGQPRIRRVRLSWNNDPNVAVTYLLAGEVDVAGDGSLRFEQASVLRDQWKPGGRILLSPTSLRYIQFQARPDYVNPKALLDVRARRAISHSIDRPSLAEAMIEDRTMVADTVPPTTVAYYGAVERAVTRYPFDPPRAQQLLAELGFRKGPDGTFAGPTEGRLGFEVRGVSGGQEEHDTTIVASQLQAAGMDTRILLLPSSARAVDDKAKGTFPGLTLNNNTLARRDLGLDKFISSRIGGDQNNWVGGNRMGWSNPEFDRLFDLWTTSLDPDQRAERIVQMMKLLSEELPALPLYYNFQVVAHTGSLRGPQPFSPEATRYGNVHQWELS